MNQLFMRLNAVMLQASDVVMKNKKMISFVYMLSLLTSGIGVAAFAGSTGAETGYALWKTTEAVLNIIFPIIVVVGVILVIVGIILLFINRFNEQSITGPLLILAVGVGLILIRALLGNTISRIAFEQMYPGESWDTYNESIGD